MQCEDVYWEAKLTMSFLNNQKKYFVKYYNSAISNLSQMKKVLSFEKKYKKKLMYALESLDNILAL